RRGGRRRRRRPGGGRRRSRVGGGGGSGTIRTAGSLVWGNVLPGGMVGRGRSARGTPAPTLLLGHWDLLCQPCGREPRCDAVSPRYASPTYCRTDRAADGSA